MQESLRIVPDTSILISGLLSSELTEKKLSCTELIIHEAVLAELEHQANEGKAIGYLGLDELKRLQEMSKGTFEIIYKGQRPRPADIRHASLGEIDALIRQLAFDEDATLMTSDKVQYEVAQAKGMKTLYHQPVQTTQKKLKFERFFDELTMSVHLRENVEPYAKKGRPGAWEFKPLRKALLKQEEIQDMSREIIEECKLRKDGFIEIERMGSTIVQLGTYRIVITKPPFSDGWEITAVHPVKRLTLEEYELTEKLQTRIAKQAEGILVAGAPGMGKSTFVQALAGFYATQDKVIKTVEAPRDLVLPENVTQYALSYGDQEEVHDMLLLTRPDYTLYDEMRNTKDFQLFTDLRLAGVGMVGVVHATNPVDAIQRFIGRVEMGVIPQVIDTVIFIKEGRVDSVLSISMTVKVPSGMTEADLARPVVVINDFETEKLEYEIYTYGEQTVVIPVSEDQNTSSVHGLAAESIRGRLAQFSKDAQVEVLSDNKCIVRVPENHISRIIGAKGATISKLEKELGISIDVQELKKSDVKRVSVKGQDIKYSIKHKKNSVILDMGVANQYKDADLFIEDEYIMTAKAGKTGMIKVKKASEQGRLIMRALQDGDVVRLVSQ